LNDGRKITRMLSLLEDHSSLVMALAQCDVPWLRNLLQTALKNGASIHTILRLIEDALERGYRPWTSGKDAQDLSLLILCLGGHNLLFSLSQCLPILSLRTLRRHVSFVKIAPTVGKITHDTIRHNIESVVIAPRAEAGLNTIRGVSFVVDETALEEAAVYLPQSNSIGGLCWTHSHCVDSTLNNYHSALNIAEALKAGDVHLGKEVLVVGAHLFNEDGVYPILAAPTCKSEAASDMEFIFESTIKSWYESGADTKVGPVWSFATDGDATRRKAGHSVFLRNPLPITSPLYGTLSNLRGLNTLTGEHEITLDFDYKHVIKLSLTLIFAGFGTMLRSRAGMHLNNGRCINSSMLERYLSWVDGVDETRATKLLYPDVPRAVELMKAVISLSELDPTKPPHTPEGTFPHVDTVADFDAIKILGHILRSLVDPFINITLSLTEQTILLSRLAHLLYACYHNQRRSFMPNQLFYDTQTLVKNAVFCIKKQQNLDLNAPFTLLDTGDDSLELLFMFLRMCGGHNSAINYKQSLDRLGATRDMGGVYARNPDIAHGHHHLNLTSRTESVDHINRSMWLGDIISGHCNLQSAWKQGCYEAVELLHVTQIPSSAYDFNTYFFAGSGIDLMCVFGEGKYPSIDDGDDNDRTLIDLLMPEQQVSVTDHSLRVYANM
ncbi:hypothetical protein DEU56DRAFT_739455, partial [Suillus clintonianus]|uniref:uncharacterized protein n=1 Tax=Suillus clintonianus TaxID=1904413 RepID=UPI001B872FE2